MRIFVPGVGCTGLALLRHQLRRRHDVLKFDKLVYAGALSTVAPVVSSS